MEAKIHQQPGAQPYEVMPEGICVPEQDQCQL